MPNPYDFNTYMPWNTSVPLQGYQSYQSTPKKQEIIRVHGEEGAKAYLLAPNSSVLLMDETDAIIWAKTTDGAGYATLKPFSIAPIEEKHSQNEAPVYVTTKEFDELKSQFEKLVKDLGGKSK